MSALELEFSDDSDSDGGIEDDGEPFDAEIYHRRPLTTGKRPFNIASGYVPSWTGEEAFRELLQNW